MRVANVLVLAALVCAASCTSKPASKPKTDVMRIGTYHAPSLVLAWYRSAGFAKELQDLVAARNAAVKAGDDKLVAECERKGAEQQDLAHEQLAGEEGTADILARLKDDLPAIAKAAEVEQIVPPGTVLGDKVLFVDVTAALVERFHPDDATKKMIAQVRKQPDGVRVH
jgi:hypothetical protein